MYFDPGMGSLIIQMVIAGLAVAGGYFAVMKTKIKSKFFKKSDENVEQDGEVKDDEL